MKVFVAREKCGCVVAAAITDPKYRSVVGEDLWDWIMAGHQVEIMDEPARMSNDHCDDCDKRSPKRKDS